MPDAPRSPEPADDSPRPPDPSSGVAPRAWGVVIWIVVAIATLGLILFLHLSGVVGPGVH